MRAPLTLLALVSVAVTTADPAAASSPTLDLSPDDGTMTVHWQPVAGAESYAVLRDGTPIATVPPTAAEFLDAGLVNGTPRVYQVRASVGGREVDVADPLRSTPVDLTPPGPTGALGAHSVKVLDGGVVVHWNATYDTATDAGQYRFYVNGGLAGMSAGGETQGVFSIGGLVAGVRHYVETEVVDRAGNTSIRRGYPVDVLDQDPPAMPVSLLVDGCSGGSVTVSWGSVAGAGGDAAVRYRVFQDGKYPHVVETANTSATVTGLASGVPVVLTIRAVDAAGNVSAPSYGVQVVPSSLVKAGCAVTTPSEATAPPLPVFDLRRTGDWSGDTTTAGTVALVGASDSGDERRYAAARILVDGVVARIVGLPANGGLREVSVPFHGQSGPGRLEAELVDDHGQVSGRRAVSVNRLAALAPDIPAGLAAVEDGDGVGIEWQPVAGAASYSVEVDGAPYGTVAAPAAALRIAPSGVPSVRAVRVTAIDGAGRRSLPSAALLVRTR